VVSSRGSSLQKIGNCPFQTIGTVRGFFVAILIINGMFTKWAWVLTPVSLGRWVLTAGWLRIEPRPFAQFDVPLHVSLGDFPGFRPCRHCAISFYCRIDSEDKNTAASSDRGGTSSEAACRAAYEEASHLQRCAGMLKRRQKSSGAVFIKKHIDRDPNYFQSCTLHAMWTSTIASAVHSTNIVTTFSFPIEYGRIHRIKLANIYTGMEKVALVSNNPQVRIFS